MVQSTLRTITFDEAVRHIDAGAAFIDLRDLGAYLEAHVSGSIGLGYEFGPGMAGRARDCIPLHVPLVLMQSDNANMIHAAASLRGKGFNVVGLLENALNLWADGGGDLSTTELVERPVPPTTPVLDVGDFGRRRYDDSVEVPIETLWARTDELRGERSLTVLCGRGLRAALAVGMLERVGIDVRLWRNVDEPQGGSF